MKSGHAAFVYTRQSYKGIVVRIHQADGHIDTMLANQSLSFVYKTFMLQDLTIVFSIQIFAHRHIFEQV